MTPAPKPSAKAGRGRLITRKKPMKVLDKTFEEQGVRITVRGYNLILTRLGFRLGDYTKAAKAYTLDPFSTTNPNNAPHLDK